MLEHGHVGHVVEMHYFYKNPPYSLRGQSWCVNVHVVTKIKESFARIVNSMMHGATVVLGHTHNFL